MKLRQLSLCGLGPFASEQVIAFSANAARPITMVWGQNGGGKTTLLTALRLCFHGRDAFGAGVSRRDYEDRVKRLFHRDEQGVVPEMWVDLAFDYDRMGKRETVRILRQWALANGHVKESLSVEGLGGLSDLRGEHWEQFCHEFLPADIASCFFFDAEQIQALVAEFDSVRAMRGAVRSLVGLNRLSQLRDDLGVLRGRMTESATVSGAVAALAAAERELSGLQRDLALAEQSRSIAVTDVEDRTRRVRECESALRSHGGAAAHELEQLAVERETLRQEEAAVRAEITDQLGSTGALAFAASLCARTAARLVAEADAARWVAVRDLLGTEYDEVVGRVRSVLEPEQGADAAEVLQALKSVAAETSAAVHLVHDVSHQERQRALGVLDAVPSIRARLSEVIHRFTSVADRLGLIEALLVRVPESDVAGPLMAQYVEAQQSLESAKVRLAQAAAAVSELDTRCREVERRVDRLRERAMVAEASVSAAHIALRAQAALQEAERVLARDKARELSLAIQVLAPRLLHKRDLVTAVQVDPETFSVELWSGRGLVAMSSLSEGEKQVLAVAVLWGLREVSGRDFPVVIDTPLGRLDSLHRARLVSEYLPKVAEQVVVLSTDTEITHSYFGDLGRYIGSGYLLVPNERGESAVIPAEWDGIRYAAV